MQRNEHVVIWNLCCIMQWRGRRDARTSAGVKDLTNIMSDGRTSILIHTLMGSHPNLLPPPCWPHLVLKESGGPPQQGGEGGGGSLLIRKLIFPMPLTSLLTNSPRAKATADNFSNHISLIPTNSICTNSSIWPSSSGRPDAVLPYVDKFPA